MTKILGISGSMRPGSISKKMVENVLENARKTPGIETELLDLSQYTLPYCDGGNNDDDRYGPVVQALRQKVAEADAFVIGTPEYHGGPSGALKNFIDLNCLQAFKKKWVALVGAAGGQLGADGALNQIRVWLKNLEAFGFNTQATLRGMDCDKQGNITNEKALKRLADMGEEFGRWVTFQKTYPGAPKTPSSC